MKPPANDVAPKYGPAGTAGGADYLDDGGRDLLEAIVPPASGFATNEEVLAVDLLGRGDTLDIGDLLKDYFAQGATVPLEDAPVALSRADAVVASVDVARIDTIKIFFEGEEHTVTVL